MMGVTHQNMQQYNSLMGNKQQRRLLQQFEMTDQICNKRHKLCYTCNLTHK